MAALLISTLAMVNATVAISCVSERGVNHSEADAKALPALPEKDGSWLKQAAVRDNQPLLVEAWHPS